MNEIVTSLQPIFAEIIMALALALAGFLVAVIRKYTTKAEEQLGVKIDADRLLVLENALKNAVVKQATVVGETTPAQVLDYLRKMSPETMEQVGLGTGADPAKVDERMKAAIARYTPTEGEAVVSSVRTNTPPATLGAAR